VAQTVNASGQVLNSFSFDAYGAPTGSAATDPYSGYGGAWGYYTDVETGLTLCGHRFYDASQARFLNRDPIGQAGGANLYQYVGGSPLMGADPLGLESIQGVLALFKEGGQQAVHTVETVAENPVVLENVGAAANLISSAGSIRPDEVPSPHPDVRRFARQVCADFWCLHISPYVRIGRLTIAGVIWGNQFGNWLGQRLYGPQTYPEQQAPTQIYFVYAFLNHGEVVYVGSTGGIGTPTQVMKKRLTKHEHWDEDAGDDWCILEFTSSRDAAFGAEQVYYDYFQMLGAHLRNGNSPLDWKKRAKRAASQRRVRAYVEEIIP
jgi:RHS repeat-associated protein